MMTMMVTMIWILIDAIAGAVARRGDLPLVDQGYACIVIIIVIIFIIVIIVKI